METAEQKLQTLFEDHVELRPAELKSNTNIAKTFLKGFVKRLTSVGKGIQAPTIVQQGSSFEGLKVGTPDEFDFLLLFDYRDRSHLIKVIESRNVSEEPDLPGFWEIRVPVIGKPPLRGKRLESRRWVKKYTETDSTRYLAPNLFRKELQTELNEYVEELRETPRLKGVSEVSYPSIGDPAFTVVLITARGREISIDISIAIRLTINSVNGSDEKTLFAKKDALDSEAKFWSNTVNAEEREKTRNIKPILKENYRTAKYLLKKVVNNSYVLKTAFFHLEQEFSHTDLSNKTGFLKEMLKYLTDSYEEGSLLAFFNTEYNVLGKYKDRYLENMTGQLRSLTNRLEHNLLEAVEDLITEAKKKQ